MVVEAKSHSTPDGQSNEPIDRKLREWTKGMSLGTNEYKFVKLLYETNEAYSELRVVTEKQTAHDKNIISTLQKINEKLKESEAVLLSVNITLEKEVSNLTKKLEKVSEKELLDENEKLKNSEAAKDRYNRLLLDRVKVLSDALKMPPNDGNEASEGRAEKEVEEQTSSLRAAHEVAMENLRTEHNAALSALETEKDQQNTKLLGDVVRIAVSAHQEKRDMESTFKEEKEVLVAQTEEKLAGTRRLFFAIVLSFFATGLLLFFSPSYCNFLYDFVANNFSPIIAPITSICRNIMQLGYEVFHQNNPPTSMHTLVSISAFTRLEGVIAPTCYESFSVAPDVALEPVKSCGINILCWFAKGCEWLGFV